MNPVQIAPPWRKVGVVAPHASDGHPAPPARAVSGRGVHGRGAAGAGGRPAVGPQPWDRSRVGPTLPCAWTHRPAAPGARAAGHGAPVGGLDPTAARRAAAATSGGLADGDLVGTCGRGLGGTHVQANDLPRHRAAGAAPVGVATEAPAPAGHHGPCGGPPGLRSGAGAPRAAAGAGKRACRHGPRPHLAGCPAAPGLGWARPAGLERLGLACHAGQTPVRCRRGAAPRPGDHPAVGLVHAGANGPVCCQVRRCLRGRRLELVRDHAPPHQGGVRGGGSGALSYDHPSLTAVQPADERRRTRDRLGHSRVVSAHVLAGSCGGGALMDRRGRLDDEAAQRRASPMGAR